MSLFQIAFKSIKQRLLPSSLTALSVALGVALMIAVIVINGIVSRMFTINGAGYDLVIGPARGSKLDLVLSSIYRISPPAENLPYRYFKQIQNDRRIDKAVPLLLGDTTEEGNFPILGTTNEYFGLAYSQDKKGEDIKFRVKGKLPETQWDAIIGSEVARKNGWVLGSSFKMIHSGVQDHVHDEKFTIVGILAPTGTPNDRTAFVNLTGFYLLNDHTKPVKEAIAREAEYFGESPEETAARYADVIPALLKSEEQGGHYHGKIPDLIKEVTAILVTLKSDPNRPSLNLTRALEIQSELQEGMQAQAVNPIQPLKRLMDNLIGNVRMLLFYLTGLIIAVSGIGIFVSIYNSMSERRKEIAIMRALGADRGRVFSIILIESILLCVGGGILGIFLGHGVVLVASPIIASRSGVIFDPLTFEAIELVILPAMIALAVLVGFIPAMTAYRTDVADNLHS